MGILDVQEKMVAIANCILSNDGRHPKSYCWYHISDPFNLCIVLNQYHYDERNQNPLNRFCFANGWICNFQL